MLVKKLLRVCPICSSEVGTVLHTQHFAVPHDYPLPAHYDVVACKQCNFVFADSSKDQSAYDYYYEEYSKYEGDYSSGSGGNDFDKKRLNDTAKFIQSNTPNKSAKILDIGCANGGLLIALRELGFEDLYGMDPSIASVEYVNNSLNIFAFQAGIFSDLDSIIEVYGQFDLIILSHVLEHIINMNGAINNIEKLLKPNGIIYIEVPDASRYPLYNVVPYYFFDCEHINHIDNLSLISFMNTCGFRAISVGEKEIMASLRQPYPAAFGLFKKDLSTEYEKNCGMLVVESVLEFCEISNQNSKIFNKLNKYVESQEPILVWGAGSYSLRLLQTTVLSKCNIVSFIDRDSKKQGTLLNGIEVRSPDYLDDFGGPIILCTALFNEDIRGEITREGRVNSLIMLS